MMMNYENRDTLERLIVGKFYTIAIDENGQLDLEDNVRKFKF